MADEYLVDSTQSDLFVTVIVSELNRGADLKFWAVIYMNFLAIGPY